jgi:hypothetical protein
MSTTLVLSNLPTNPIDVSVHRFATGDFKLRQVAKDTDGSIFGEYVFAGGDPTVETTALYRSSAPDKVGYIRNSLRLRTTATVTTDSVVTEVSPDDVIITWTNKGPYEDPAAIMKMIGCAYGLTFGTLSSKVPQTEIVSGLNRALLGALLS